ncbi:MAG: helix-turn-helix transcriptional regulator, partial [Myxococcaceae bacterium]|nr:helix-turn-helix transcriptional regulator [Myxococcaceae bacterium]
LTRITALAKQLGLELDALEKRFRAVVGSTPKQFASVVRLQRAVAAYRRGASLTQAAFDAGYFDQSHFIRAFRAATGEAPRTFLRRAQ